MPKRSESDRRSWPTASRPRTPRRNAGRKSNECRIVAPLQVRPPLPVQQRAAVGEVAIPIARATVAVGKLVPVVGELVILAEVTTGRSIAGLGEKLEVRTNTNMLGGNGRFVVDGEDGTVREAYWLPR